MSGLDALGERSLAELTEVVARLKHDLGKYVAFQIRWLPPDASSTDRLAALQRDLLQTRSGPNGIVDAVTVWAEFEGLLTGAEPLPSGEVADLREEPSLRRIQHHMASLSDLLPALRGGTIADDGVTNGINDALAVASACRDLQRRVRAARGADHG